MVGNNYSDRVINLDAGTRYVNVTNGETVQFVQQGKSFSWHVDTYPNVTEVDLKQIAPAGFDAGAIEVYVASNPLYRG
ncbi:CzcE family metal-binding protein [Duganella sp. FT109W]|uniref:CzcE family metal-binding protein n=1 Tax=Duganella margarita TaxID=2692170 RepID=A0ABW9WAC7_9BURK|nr:CzcE family metal-binding protein [Duganella margarita]